MRNYTMIICLSCFAILLMAISDATELQGHAYAYKETYRGLNIEVEGIFLTTDSDTGSTIANIPIRIKNHTGKTFTFQSEKIKCNGKKVTGDIVDEYVRGEIESGACKEDVITVEINEKDRNSIDNLVFTYKICDMKADSSKSFSIKEEFSEG